MGRIGGGGGLRKMSAHNISSYIYELKYIKFMVNIKKKLIVPETVKIEKKI